MNKEAIKNNTENVNRLMFAFESEVGPIPARWRKKMINRFEARIEKWGPLSLSQCKASCTAEHFRQRAFKNLLEGHEVDAANLLLLAWYVGRGAK